MKTALCIKKADVVNREFPDHVKHGTISHELFYAAKTSLLDRAICETNKDYLQIIPYITLFDYKTKNVFLYQRGKKSNENRLHGMCSVGLGGHIESTVKDDIYDTIACGAVRELNEEIGLPASDALYTTIKTKLIEGNYLCYYNWEDDVGQVHLGVMLTLAVDSEKLVSQEKDIIEKGQWLSVQEIKELVMSGEIQLEKWSTFVMTIIEEMYGNNFESVGNFGLAKATA